MVTKSGYTQEETVKLLDLYKVHGTDNIEEIARILEKPVKSIRSKLVHEKVYEPSKIKYNKKTGKSKKELLRELESIISKEVPGLLGATKESIATIITVLKKEE